MTFTYRVLLKPKDICFKSKLLPSSFDNGILLRETLQQLSNKEILIEDVPTIDVVWCKEKWQWYTLNNRRLWVFRELEKKGKCQYITTKRVETVEHVTDFLLYGSAELIGESQSVSWNSDDGLTITVFNEANSGDKQDRSSTKELAEKNNKAERKGGDGDNNMQIQREWREMTPLTIKITWDNEKDKKVENNAEPETRLVQTLKATQNGKRERKDSGFSETSSGVRSVDKSRACEIKSESESDREHSIRESNSHTRRFNKFHRYRPYSRPESSDSSSESREKDFLNSRRRQSALQNLVCQRKGDYEHLLFILHHGDIPRKEQFTVKTKLMNTCGLCFKSFKAGVSLSQHVEELRHWACTRCGKYFNSYTALGQHKLSLERCNV